MRWTPGGRSDDLEDRRDDSGDGGGGGFNFGGMHIGIGGFLILLVLSIVFKRNFLSLAGVGGGMNTPTQVSRRVVDCSSMIFKSGSRRRRALGGSGLSLLFDNRLAWRRQ